MKINTIMIALTLLASFAKAQHPFTVDGQLGADKQGIIYLDYTSRGKYILDSAEVKNGEFSFKGLLGDPVYATLNLNPYRGPISSSNPVKQDVVKFMLDGKTTVQGSGDLKSAAIKGSKVQDEYLKRDELFKPLNEQLAVLTEQIRPYYLQKDVEGMKPYQAKIAELTKKAKEIDSAFIIQHPDSYLAFDIWRSKHRGYAKPEWRKEFERFASAIRNSEEGKLMKKKIDQADALTPGHTAPSFTLKDLSGKDFTLTSQKGKNVLLCFWVRNFINFETFSLYMRRAEKRLKDKNTVFVGISYDDYDTWRTAATENFADWINVTEAGPNGLGDGTGKVAESYGIYNANSLPTAFLIGPDGKLITSKLTLNDTELGIKLEKLVK